MVDTDELTRWLGVLYLGSTCLSIVSGAVAEWWAPAGRIAEAADKIGLTASRVGRRMARGKRNVPPLALAGLIGALTGTACGKLLPASSATADLVACILDGAEKGHGVAAIARGCGSEAATVVDVLLSHASAAHTPAAAEARMRARGDR